jgi:hypothetical protein
VRGVGEAGKLSLPDSLLRLRGPRRLTIDAVGFKAGDRPCAPLSPCSSSTVLSLSPSLCPDKKEKRGKNRRGRRNKKGNRKKYQSPKGVALPSFLSHGREGIDSFHHHTEASTKTHEACVYGGGRA